MRSLRTRITLLTVCVVIIALVIVTFSSVLTYYYRIDPEVSDTVKGFWYTNLDGDGFVAHQVTDITLYDTQDTSSLVWFTVPKYEGKPIWLPPYITDNLNARVISYNVPIYWRGRFVGVVGIAVFDPKTDSYVIDTVRRADKVMYADKQARKQTRKQRQQNRSAPVIGALSCFWAGPASPRPRRRPRFRPAAAGAAPV